MPNSALMCRNDANARAWLHDAWAGWRGFGWHAFAALLEHHLRGVNDQAAKACGLQIRHPFQLPLSMPDAFMPRVKLADRVELGGP